MNLILGIVLIISGLSLVLKDVYETGLSGVEEVKLERDSNREQYLNNYNTIMEIKDQLMQRGEYLQQGKIMKWDIVTPAKPKNTKCGCCGKSYLEPIKKGG